MAYMKVRYQVLWDAEKPKTGSESQDFDSNQAAQANTFAREQRKAGKKNVSVWDTLNNPFSDMFRL